MKVSEAIKILESKVLKSEENLKHFHKESQGYAANEARIIAYNIAINKLEQIDEPQCEKVEVTEKQAELLRAFRDESLYELLANCLREDEELMAKARLFGYTVNPKRWVVTTTDSDTCYLKRFRMGKECLDGDISKVWVGELGWAFAFDDKSKAEAVATLVEGSVEEV